MLCPKILRRLSKSFFENPSLPLKYFVDFRQKRQNFLVTVFEKLSSERISHRRKTLSMSKQSNSGVPRARERSPIPNKLW